MRFSLYLNWLPTESEYLNYVQLLKNDDKDGLFQWRPDWTPKFDFVNATDYITSDSVRWEFKQNYGKFRITKLNEFCKEPDTMKTMIDGFDGDNALFICCRLNCDLSFAQEFDLKHFPFDCQDLSMLMCDKTEEKYNVKFMPYLSGLCFRFVTIDSTYSVLNEWIMDGIYLNFDHRLHERGTKLYAFIELRIKLRRKWMIFFWRQFFFMWFFAGIGLTSFSIDYQTDIAERLGFIVTLLLTMVAFSLVIDDKIPRVAYLTYLEEYMLVNYVYLAYLAIETALAPVYDLDDEHWFYYSLFAFIGYQIAFMIYAIFLRNLEKGKIECDAYQMKKFLNRAKGAFAIEYDLNDIYHNIEKNMENYDIKKQRLTFKQTVDTKADSLRRLNESYRQRHSQTQHVMNTSPNGYTSIQADETSHLC